MKNDPERRKSKRRKFTFYMAVMDYDSGELIGHLTEISDFGFRLDCPKALPVNQDFKLSVELTADFGGQAFMVLSARSKWCREDKLMPNAYNVGFQVMDLSPDDVAIYNLMLEKYGEG
ncbi:MAG TPA: hypothetical protein VHM28_10495 [Anaerolineales bacterium]|nr:hypothetical protein [Anaerolineales bacterium]